MKLHEAQQLTLDLMRQHNLIASGWFFEFDYSVKRFGATHWDTQKITLSRSLVELNNIEQVKDTILHEIAHAKAGKHNGHNRKWHYIALSIGCNGNRLYKSNEVVTPPSKYIATCPNGHTHTRNKKMKISCSKCCPRFNKKYLFKFTINPEYK